MRKLMTCLLLLCSLLLSQQIQAQELTYEQAAATNWVLNEANTPLSEEQAISYVQHAYLQATKYSIDPIHILAMMRVESRFNHKARSSENAQGLMQVIPKYHKAALAKRSPYDPLVSIEVGTSIYNDCLQRFKGNTLRATSCYSGGGGRKYYSLIEEQKKKLMKHLIVQLFQSDDLVASR